jgi:DNA-binding XRE family transcriptional regulator
MKLDPKLIKAEREKRAWSQEQLARVSSLGLRTIQRIEKAGAASFESAKALAAVFEVDVSSLRMTDPAPKLKAALPSRPLLGAAAVLLTTGGGLLVTTSGFADAITLDIGIAASSPPLDAGAAAPLRENELTPEGDDSFRVVIVPTVAADHTVRLAAQIFELQDSSWVLVSESTVVTADGKEAEIRLAADSGQGMRFVIAPHASALKRADGSG